MKCVLEGRLVAAVRNQFEFPRICRTYIATCFSQSTKCKVSIHKNGEVRHDYLHFQIYKK